MIKEILNHLHAEHADHAEHLDHAGKKRFKAAIPKNKLIRFTETSIIADVFVKSIKID